MKIPIRISQTSTKGVTIDNKTFVFHHQGEGAAKFQECYLLGKKLANSNSHFENVFGCIHRATKEHRSVKILSREVISHDIFMAKLDILQKLNHPNVVHIYESFQDDRSYYVVSENLAPYDNLYQAITATKTTGARFGDAHVAQILLTLFECLNYCHDSKVIHGNVQPKNILVLKGNGGMAFDKLLLVNFFQSSTSLTRRTTTKSPTRTSTPNDSDDDDTTTASAAKRKTRFAAPEAGPEGGSHTKSDIWSCGIIGYHLLTGQYPFVKPSDTRKPIQNWKGVSSPEAQEFLQELLSFRPSARPTAAEAYDADWLAVAKSVQVQVQAHVQEEVMQALSKYSKKDKLQQAVSAYIATHLLAKIDKEKWDEIFRTSDRNSDGVIDKKELQGGFQKAGIRLPPSQMDELFVRLDMDGNGVVDYSEFLATQDDLLYQKDKLRAAFEAFDTDGNGYIEKEDLQVLFNSPGEEKVVNKAVAKAMLKGADQDGDGRLSFDEFVAMMVQH